MTNTQKKPRTNPTHAWLMGRGWRKVGEVSFGNRVQFQWQHDRNGERQYSTSMAEQNEINAIRRGEAAPLDLAK